MKLIDADKLKATIKAQIKERNEWLKDIDRSDRQDQLWSDLNGEDMSILQIITSLQQEQPDCIEKTARISPGLVSNFWTSTYVLDVDLSQDEVAKIVPFGFSSGKIKIKIVCE